MSSLAVGHVIRKLTHQILENVLIQDYSTVKVIELLILHTDIV